MGGVVLRDRDVEALTGYLAMLAAPATVDEVRQRAVEGLPSVVPSVLTAWNEVDPRTGLMLNPVILPAPTVYPGGTYEAGHAIFAAHLHEHPVVQNFLRTGDGRPYAISDFLTREQFEATGIYQQFYRPLGVEEQLALQLPFPDPIVAVTLHGDWGSYGPRDRALLNVIRPQLVQSLRNARALERLDRLRRAVEQRIEDAGEGLVLLDRLDQVEYASPHAREILARWLGGWQRTALPEDLRDWVRHQEAGTGPPAPPWPLIRRRAGRQLTIRRLPVAGAGDVALLVTERQVGPGAAPLLARLGLTPRQAEVLDLAVQGCSNARIAGTLGITVNTVESHMTSAMAKLGVESRTAAANLVHQALDEPPGAQPDAGAQPGTGAPPGVRQPPR